jgi:lipoprotein-anchoring transpeptidase ErfK/SrfK
VDAGDRQALLELDRVWSERHAGERGRSWRAPNWLRTGSFRARRPSAGHRTARPADSPARPAGR